MRQIKIWQAVVVVAVVVATALAACSTAKVNSPSEGIAADSARLVADGQVLSLDARPVASAAIHPAAPDSPQIVRVAAANSSEAEKAAADFVCTGTNDEAVLTKAVETLTWNGEMWVDAMGNRVDLMIPTNDPNRGI